MVKKILLVLDDEKHEQLKEKKEEMRKKLELQTLNWETFVLKLAKV